MRASARQPEPKSELMHARDLSDARAALCRKRLMSFEGWGIGSSNASTIALNSGVNVSPHDFSTPRGTPSIRRASANSLITGVFMFVLLKRPTA